MLLTYEIVADMTKEVKNVMLDVRGVEIVRS